MQPYAINKNTIDGDIMINNHSIARRAMRLVSLLVISFWLAGPIQAAQSFEISAFSVPTEGRLVVPVVESDALTGIAAQVDELTNGALTRAATEADFSGKAGSSVTLLGVAPFSRVDLIGVGADLVSRVAAEDFGGTAAALLGDTKGGEVNIL
jgi:leucyl aminopeptidase